MPNKSEASGLGMDKNASATLAYFLGPITGVLVLILERNSYTRFHSMQSIIVFGGLIVVQWILGVTIIFARFIPIISLLMFILWLVLLYKAWHGEEWGVPFVEKYVRKLLRKTS